MFIGIARFDLFLPESTSLKHKRRVLRHVIDGARHRYNASVSEVDHQDLWQRAAIGVTCASGDHAHCLQMLQEVEKALGRAAVGGAEIVGRSVQVVSMDDL
jgi:uncharacterized protein YlxP (DUF503 family)